MSKSHKGTKKCYYLTTSGKQDSQLNFSAHFTKSVLLLTTIGIYTEIFERQSERTWSLYSPLYCMLLLNPVFNMAHLE